MTSGFIILLHAHDKVWSWKEIPLRERIQSCEILKVLMAGQTV